MHHRRRDSEVGIWNRMELVGNPASGSLNGSLNGAYYIASSMPHITKQASTTHNFQLVKPRKLIPQGFEGTKAHRMCTTCWTFLYPPSFFSSWHPWLLPILRRFLPSVSPFPLYVSCFDTGPLEL